MKKEHIEKQTHLIVMSDAGRLESITLRGPIIRHGHCGCGHNNIIGDRVFWHKSDFNMTRVDGIVLAVLRQDWNYDRPIGQRAMNVIQEGEWSVLIKQAHLRP